VGRKARAVGLVTSSRRRVLVAASAVVGSACLAGSGLGAQGHVTVLVTPPLSLADQSVQVMVSGLAPHQLVTVEVRSVDAKRILWKSATAFRADSGGRLNLSRASALGGSYSQGLGYPSTWGMGVIAMMQPPWGYTPWGGYIWAGVQRFTVSVRAYGHTVGSKVFWRKLSARPLHVQHLSLRADGFIGDYWTPAKSSGTRPAILAFGGSEGGEGTYFLASLLAAHGYPTLALAYFKEPGLPQTLANIPLEYFARALRWLHRQPQVNPNRILTLGSSRGSEAALLLGVHYPDLVHGVIANVPSDVANCSYPGCGGPAWTLAGKPLPYTHQSDQPYPTDNPAAVIPVEQIHGPVFLDCAGEDQFWVSCAYATAITHRLNAHHDRYRHILERFPLADHLIDGLVPYEPNTLDPSPTGEQARETLWPELLGFLAHV
jgi:dienelactone hydrolase